MLITNDGQCNGRSMYLNAEEVPVWREGEPQHTYSVYRRTETDLVSVLLRRPRPVVCCRRSKPLTNNLPRLASGVHCFVEKSWHGLSRRSLHHQEEAVTHPLSANPMLPGWHVYSEKLNERNKTCHPHLQK